MTDQPETAPVRKSSLPCTPPSEWEFHTWFPHPDGGGDMVPGERQRGVLVRRCVTYSDWEPVRPGRWADEPETDAAAPAPVLPPADRAAHVFPLPARAALITYAATTRTVTADDLTPLLDAFDAECSASALRKAADEIDRTDLPDDHVDMFDNGARWATSQLRRMAAEARDNCPGYETVPNRCTCGCEGCKHHCGAHNPDDAQDAEPADRAAVYREVADRLAADAEQGAKDGLTRIYRRSAARQVREWADELGAEARGNDKQDDPTWPRRAWDLGLLHKGGDPHHCPACVAQPEPPKNFICPGAEANVEVLANPQPAAEARQDGEA